MTIPMYPTFSEVTLEQRASLHGRFQALPDGISELTFAGLYLFRAAHQYRIARLDGDLVVISGEDAGAFFMLPFGLPEQDVLNALFRQYRVMTCVSPPQAERLGQMGYPTWEDRDNFDYVYSREALSRLSGRRLHKKKNLVNVFVRNNTCLARPLLEEHVPEALAILDGWVGQQDSPGDAGAAREALEKMEPLQLCGGIFYVNDRPVAYSLGEELARGTMWVTHFEKAVVADAYKGIYQYINQAFASILPEKYERVNREQDLGDPGLRQAKESYQPVAYVRKYRAGT